MKHTGIILTMLMVSVWSVFAQSNFIYTSEGEKLYFTVRKDKVLIKTNQESNASSLSAQDAFQSVSIINGNTVIATVNPLDFDIEQLPPSALISDMTYMLEYTNGELQCPTDKIFVKCNGEYTIEQVIAGIQEQVVSAELTYPESEVYTLTLNTKLNDVLALTHTLFESGLCEFAEPSFLRLIQPANPYYGNQWGFNNTGQYGGNAGCDIKAPEAWNITKGSSNIKVAVVDEGVDLNHPDLYSNLLAGYDATDAYYGGADGSMTGGNHHGTACAGIIAAADNDIGVVGVAPACKIIPVRIAYTYYGMVGFMFQWITYDDWVADGIRYAWHDAGADVISNSWSWTSFSSTISAEIQNALTLGRNGKGSVVVFASGNKNSEVSYPANSNPNILAVGAISPCCERKRSSHLASQINDDRITPDPQGVSCDGETGWGSNYGTTLDIVAPGVFIPTTDISGPNGTNQGGGDFSDVDYTQYFNGTSSACPHVAGVAALVLSVNPKFTAVQVNNIIESTAQKVGSYTYQSTAGRLNGSWNNEMGYGLVDAYAAVSLAKSLVDTGLEDNTAKEILTTDCYSMTGIKINCSSDTPGVVFKRTNFTDGSTQVVKELR